jgi:ADP-ribosylglycohydrolase
LQIETLTARILGSLTAACIGDALGAPTEQRSIAEIRSLWGGRVERFEDPPPDSPFAKGRRAGQITDDASQMIALTDAIIERGGDVTAEDMAKALLRWSEDEEYFPRFAGPSTKGGLERLRDGADPRTSGSAGRLTSEGTSNGAAMRIAPAGLIHPGDVDAAVAAALPTCLPTHGTNLAISGACAVAGAVAAALDDDAEVLDVVRAARRAALLGEDLGKTHGRETAGPSVVDRLDMALEVVSTAPDLDTAVSRLASRIGAGLHISEAVPSAIGIFAAASGDPFLTVVGGANIGDDTDTVACIAGSVAGAFRGIDALPDDLVKKVVAANDLDLEPRARALAEIAR